MVILAGRSGVDHDVADDLGKHLKMQSRDSQVTKSVRRTEWYYSRAEAATLKMLPIISASICGMQTQKSFKTSALHGRSIPLGVAAAVGAESHGTKALNWCRTVSNFNLAGGVEAEADGHVAILQVAVNGLGHAHDARRQACTWHKQAPEREG